MIVRTSLLHAAHRWPKAIETSLWSTALKHYVYITNYIPTEFTPGLKSGRRQIPHDIINSPLSRFSGIEQKVNFNHFHPFGSHVYVLHEKLQAKLSDNKRIDRSRVGIFQTTPLCIQVVYI